ncbi:hypothetical protein A2U01_0074217, partial [Trifolium medium]|nr:hypothetical protein [Trifolium medium]
MFCRGEVLVAIFAIKVDIAKAFDILQWSNNLELINNFT